METGKASGALTAAYTAQLFACVGYCSSAPQLPPSPCQFCHKDWLFLKINALKPVLGIPEVHGMAEKQKISKQMTEMVSES